jgi:hypothetical protein
MLKWQKLLYFSEFGIKIIKKINAKVAA